MEQEIINHIRETPGLNAYPVKDNKEVIKKIESVSSALDVIFILLLANFVLTAVIGLFNKS